MDSSKKMERIRDSNMEIASTLPLNSSLNRSRQPLKGGKKNRIITNNSTSLTTTLEFQAELICKDPERWKEANDHGQQYVNEDAVGIPF